MGAVQDPASAAVDQASREEIDSRSIYVGNVDCASTTEEVQQHFQSCNRVTILTDKFGNPKGFAYVEFLEQEAVQEALQLNETELHNRQLKVMVKMTNVPGMKQYHPKHNPCMGYAVADLGLKFSYGRMLTGQRKVPRFRRPMRYMPYY